MKLVNPKNGDIAYLKTEKRPNIEFKKRDDLLQKSAEMIEYVPKNPVNFKQMIEETMKALGSNFHKYTASQHNCQEWILSLINSMAKLKNDEVPADVEKFIYQDPMLLFKNISTGKKIADYVTDLGHKVGRVAEVFTGGKKKKRHRKKHVKFV